MPATQNPEPCIADPIPSPSSSAATQMARVISSTVISLGDTGRQSTVSGQGSRASTADGADGSLTLKPYEIGAKGVTSRRNPRISRKPPSDSR